MLSKETNCQTIHYLLSRKMTIFIKGATFDTEKLQTGEFLHLDFAFYNFTSIRAFTKIIIVVWPKTSMILVFQSTSKLELVIIIRFFLKKFKKEQHTWKHMRVEEDGALEKLMDVI